jgi:hypothetical protein
MVHSHIQGASHLQGALSLQTTSKKSHPFHFQCEFCKKFGTHAAGSISILIDVQQSERCYQHLASLFKNLLRNGLPEMDPDFLYSPSNNCFQLLIIPKIPYQCIMNFYIFLYCYNKEEKKITGTRRARDFGQASLIGW